MEWKQMEKLLMLGKFRLMKRTTIDGLTENFLKICFDREIIPKFHRFLNIGEYLHCSTDSVYDDFSKDRCQIRVCSGNESLLLFAEQFL